MRIPTPLHAAFAVRATTVGNLRQLTRNVLPKLRGSDPGARLARIQHVLDRVEVFVARLLKRLRATSPPRA